MKSAHQKSERGSLRSDLEKLDSFTLETSENHLIRNFLRNRRLKVKTELGKNEPDLKLNKAGEYFYTICISKQPSALTST